MIDDIDRQPLERLTTAEQVARRLRELILHGAIEPGTPLREVSMGDSWKVSRNTVREALRLLASEGLVRHNIHHGVTVTRLEEKDVVEITRVRVVLELRGIETSPPTAEQCDELEAAAEAFARAVHEVDWPRAFDSDMRLHTGIVALIGSRRLTDFFAGILRELRLAYFLCDGFETEGLPNVVGEHREIARLIRQGERARGSELLVRHLGDSQQILLDLMHKRNTGGDRANPSEPGAQPTSERENPGKPTKNLN